MQKRRTSTSWLRSEGRKDLLTALGLLLFAVGGFVFINPNGSGVFAGPGGMTWRTMPFVYAGLLVVFSLIYVVQSVARIRAEVAADAGDGPSANDKVVLVRRGATLGFLLAYVLLLRVFGFAVMTPLFLFALFRLYGRGHWRGDLGIALVGGLLLWGLFVRVLRLNLDGDVFDPVTPLLFGALRAVGL